MYMCYTCITQNMTPAIHICMHACVHIHACTCTCVQANTTTNMINTHVQVLHLHYGGYVRQLYKTNIHVHVNTWGIHVSKERYTCTCKHLGYTCK